METLARANPRIHCIIFQSAILDSLTNVGCTYATFVQQDGKLGRPFVGADFVNPGITSNSAALNHNTNNRYKLHHLLTHITDIYEYMMVWTCDDSRPRLFNILVCIPKFQLVAHIYQTGEQARRTNHHKS